ncbi:histidine kinase N-terminal domain-containing protein [Breznakiellaceae bacterium SP9]
MIDHVLIDTLTLKGNVFANKWKDSIRKNPQLKHYNMMDDASLIEINAKFYPLLGRTLDRGLDRTIVGGSFVDLAKERMKGKFPVSELIYGCNLSQKAVIDYLMNDYAPESQVKMYQAMGIVNKVSEFFLLGCFYITKGYLEETYLTMSKNKSMSNELLKEYFRDDFFFKQRQD